jgi:hypothetical protein
MTSTYDPKITAVLCIDFYNDFLSAGGKLWPWVKDIAEEVNLLDNLRTIVRTAREAGIKIYHVPHHRWESGDYVDWNTRRLISSAQQSDRLLRRTLGVGLSTTTSRRSRATSSQLSIGHRVDFRTPTSNTSSSDTARKRSSASACWRIPALKPRHASEWSSASMSRWFETGQQPAHMRPCMPCSISTDRPLPMRS